MTTVLLALGLIAWLGSILCYILKDLDVGAGRKMIGVLVLNVFLPALVFRVIYTSEMGSEFYQIPLTILLSTVACLGVAILVFRAFKLQPQEKGALILASAFGNVTYLGLPVLQGLFPTLALEVTKVAILCEVTTTPLNLSLGMTLGARFKGVMRDQEPKETEADLAIGAFPLLTPFQTCVKLVRQTVQEMVKLPTLWAVAIALVWKLSGLPVPAFLLQATQILGNTVTGLMMLSLGMGLRYRRIYQPLPLLIAGGIKLLISPLVVFGIATLIGIQSPYLEAIVLEGAMPTQLLTFIIADRIGLNSERLALCILINTATSFLTIPLMKTLLFGGRAISFHSKYYTP